MTSAQDIELSFTFPTIPHTFLRGNRALILLKDQEGKYVVGAKNVYPKDIYRFAGGGIEDGEDPETAVCRELTEELGIKRDHMRQLATVSLTLNSPGQTVQMKIYLFTTTLKAEETLTPSDDLDGVMHLTTDEMRALIDRFYHLQDVPDMAWSHYGTVYGKIHEIALSLE